MKVGETYRWWCHPIGGSYKIHIVSVIDEGIRYCPMIVFRYFGKHKQWWHYEIRSADMVESEIETAKENLRKYNLV